MKNILLCLVVCLVAGAVGQRNMWEQADRAHSAKSFSFRVSLSQSNLDVLESALLDVSSPRSPNYGKWWTYEQVQDLVAPPKETTERIVSFFSSKNFIVVNHRDSLKVTASVKEIEELFQIKLFTFLHKTERQMIVRAVEQYTVPAEIASDVDMIAGLLEFPQVRKQAVKGIDDEDEYVVPAVINYLYQIPDNFPVNPNSSLCLVEFQGDQSVSYNDLSNFTSLNEISSFNVAHVVGTFNGTDMESTLDVEYGAAIAQKAPIWYWTESTWMYEFSVDLLATNSPPLVVSMSWGWPEPNQCQIDKSDPDCKLFEKNSQKYVDKTNVEFQKAGLLGITLLAASGDQGAPGDDNPECNPIKINKLSSIFPGASPWVLSVGATMLYNETTANIPVPPLCSSIPCTNWTSEESCSIPTALITSGGGFSNYVAQPDYQKTAVDAYLSSGVALPPSFFFNKNNRAFPDVAALGHNYLIYMDENWSVVDGTSASTPVWAGIVSLLNSYRLNNNKSPLGFIVPLIYEAYASDPTIFTDITIGNNKCTEDCCSKYGYEAAKGWDPVTGLGSPVFPKLLKYVASLP